MILRMALLAALSTFALHGGTASIVAGKVRVQVLSPTLVRLEVLGPKGVFEDRPTFHVVGRDWPGATVTQAAGDGRLRVATAAWTVELPAGATDLKAVRILDGTGAALWTGDAVCGNSAWLPSPGEHPRAFAVADTPRIVPPAWGLTPVPAGAPGQGWDLANDAPDVYVFLPGGDYGTLRRDFLKLTGPTELPPLFAFGLFHSRYWAYSDQEALQLVAKYRDRGFPLDVLVVDTDWRVGASHGYGENKTLFPDMVGFLGKAHEAGVKVMFNDHPEPQAETAMDPAELAYRWEGLSRWLKAGLDVWWYDRNWNIGLVEPLPGLRKEVWGMQLYRDMTAKALPGRRPLMMANVDGIDDGHRSAPPDLAAHRFPIQWTGDTMSDWDYLRHAVENVLHEGALGLTPYVGEDLTGHMGTPSVELYVRFLEYGTLSPTLRLHSSNSPAFLREPWAFGPEAERIARDYVRLRYRLLPSLYAAARRNYDTGEPLLRRLDLVWPDQPEAAREDQYLLGDGLLVAPVIAGEPSNPLVPVALLKAENGQPGLTARYYPNREFAGPAAATRVEPGLDFSTTRGSAPKGVPAGPMSATWNGTFTPDRPLQLGLMVEEEGRLFLDGREVLARWGTGNWAATLDPALTLQAGRSYALRVDYRKPAAPGRCRLFQRAMDNPGPHARKVWLPPGTWIDVWTGERLQGPATLTTSAALDRVPMYVREGTLIPLAPDAARNTATPWNALTLDLYPGPKATAELYEDDGASQAYQTGAFRRTALTQELDPTGKLLTVTLAAPAGSCPGAPAARAWTLRIHRAPGSPAPKTVTVAGIPCSTWTLVPRGNAATPFQVEGPALDGDLLEIRLPSAAVEQERRILIGF